MFIKMNRGTVEGFDKETFRIIGLRGEGESEMVGDAPMAWPVRARAAVDRISSNSCWAFTSPEMRGKACFISRIASTNLPERNEAHPGGHAF